MTHACPPSPVPPLLEPLEPRCLLSESAVVAQLPVPYRTGQTFVVEDYDSKITSNDMGFNYFMGNTGVTESAQGIMTTALSPVSSGSTGGSLRAVFNFAGQSTQGTFAGVFHSLFGLTDTLVSLTGDGIQPSQTTPFPGYFLDSRDLFRGLAGYEDRSVETLQFDVRLETAEAVTLKIELKDENRVAVYARRVLAPGEWTTVSLNLPTDFSPRPGNVSAINWGELNMLTFIVERLHVADGVSNPDLGAFLLDNIRLADSDGLYPDYCAMRDPATGALRSEYTDAFLDQVRELSSQYFRDFASTDPRTGGIVQDRSTFADLMTVGGAGFQLSAYVVGAERGYISRSEAAAWTRDILEVLYDQPMGPERVGTIGYNGFFYHFLGIDGLRKHNFDFQKTPGIDESKNTVEVSVIDTTLALAGVLTSAQYFTDDSAVEGKIRSLAQAIYERVDWTFMYNQDLNQFYLAWKPNENRYNDDTHGRFLLDDAKSEGQYSSKWEDGQEKPATLDYYTDEAVLAVILAAASPTHPVPISAFYSPTRVLEDGFVKTYPGSLFTYQFAGVWLHTEALQADGGNPSIDYYENTQAATEAARQYTMTNPQSRETWDSGRGAWLWGLSACEGPFDQYFADSAPTTALASGRPAGATLLEAEDGAGDGTVMSRGNASGEETLWLRRADEIRTMTVEVPADVTGSFAVRYSNDNWGNLETVDVRLDGQLVGSFRALDTGDGGHGWNVFETSGVIGSALLTTGSHTVSVSFTGGDGYGIEIDKIDLTLFLPLETGTVTAYAVGSAVPYVPEVAAESLWRIALQDMNSDSLGDLLHPRFGMADAFNFDVAPAAVLAPGDALRTTGPWWNPTGFAIDHGPMLLLIDNYLGRAYDGRVKENLVPMLFMSSPRIHDVLASLFPSGHIPPAVETWMGDGSGLWEDGANWSAATVPWPVTTARIDGAAAQQPVMGQDQTVWGLNLAAGGALTFAPGAAKTLVTRSLTIAESGGLPTARLDIGSGAIVIDYTGRTNPIADVRQWILQGYHDIMSAWDGNGITSSTAALDPITYGIGCIDNAAPDLLLPFGDGTTPTGPLFGNVTPVAVNPESVLVKLTYNGDVTLDGVVDDNDVTFMNLFYDGGASSTHTWWTGDIFLNDGFCDDNDITILNLTYGLGIGHPLGGAVSAADVPGAVGAALPMAALPVLMTAAAIQPELLVEEADVLAYAQAASPRQAPLASASAAGGADAPSPARMARSGATGGSAFLPSGGTFTADDPPLLLLTAASTPLAWSTAAEVSSAPNAVLSPDGGVEDLLLLPALEIPMR